MKPVAIGFIGAGFSANLHVEGLKTVYGVPVRLAAVTAGRRERAEAFAAHHGVGRVHGTWEELLADPDVDAVCLCVPNALHAPVAIAAARAGKHVICEKPMTGAFGPSAGTGAERARIERERALESVAAIEAAVREGGVRFLYAENWVYAPSMAKTKRLLDITKAPIIDIRAEESHSGSHALRSRRRETAGGGALLMLGAHPIGAALHLKHHEGTVAGVGPVRPVSVTADVAALYESEAVRRGGHGNVVSDWVDVETWANLVIRFADGTRATIAASFAMLGGVRNSFEVYTTRAAIRSQITPNDALMAFAADPATFGTEYLHEKVESRTGWISASADEDWARGYPQEMQDFVEAIAHDREPLSGIRLAADTVAVIYAAYQSAAEGSRIDLA